LPRATIRRILNRSDADHRQFAYRFSANFHDGQRNVSSECVMTIHTIEYRGYALRAYSQQIFPPHGDPFAKGPKRFSAIVQIDVIPSDSTTSKRYSPAIKGAEPASAEDAIELAMQHGRDIIDGKVQAGALYNARSGRFSRSVRRFQPPLPAVAPTPLQPGGADSAT
jgi:hypothetical protein